MTEMTDVRRATRDLRAPLLGGVAGGLARHLAVPVLWVRLAFVALTAVSGLGAMLYAGLWLMMPVGDRFGDDAPGLASASRGGRRPFARGGIREVGPAVAVAALGFGVVLVVEAVFGSGALFWPVVVGLVGVALLWRQADEAQRERWLDAGGRIDPFRAVFGRGGWAAYTRVVVGLLLVIGAVTLVGVAGPGGSGLGGAGIGGVLVAGMLGVGGLVLVLVPWALRLVDDLGAERAERIRTQDRADVAAHLHDSVLQTLALIQRNAGDPATVSRLARSQERDLRSWLYAGESADATTLAGALRATAARVEDDHGVQVDVVTVGDLDSDERLRPLVQAAGEALTNAAKHAGTDRVDVYAEITAEAADVFVRDRGVGFDPQTIGEDRLGVRASIIDRMTRHGGRADIRSAPGEGTEVRLHMPVGHEEE